MITKLMGKRDKGLRGGVGSYPRQLVPEWAP
jgi:hypothetical protein